MQVTTQTGTKVDFSTQTQSKASAQTTFVPVPEQNLQKDKSAETEKQPREKPIPTAEKNPDVWSVADLVQAQHINALFPHPDSQSAKEIKAHGASTAYGAFYSIKS